MSIDSTPSCTPRSIIAFIPGISASMPVCVCVCVCVCVHACVCVGGGGGGGNTLKAEALSGVVLCGEEGLELDRKDEAIEETEGLLLIILELLGLFKLGADPILLFKVGNVRELNAHSAAVGLLHDGNNFTKLRAILISQ